MKHSREAVFLSLLRAQRDGTYLSESLSEWKNEFHPSEKDFRLAQEIAYGTMRMKNALDFFARKLAPRGLNVKRNEKIILSMAIYQYYYMDRIPAYAIVNESVALAKKHCHPRSIPFLNAILRKLEKTDLSLPQGDSIEELSIRLSYPEEYISALIHEYGLKLAKNILNLENHPPILMGRLRTGSRKTDFNDLVGGMLPIVKLETLPSLSDSEVYIQNATPAFLIGECSKFLKKSPKKILDMCSSPGGKAIAIHDLFPKAFLHVNDISEKKMATLKENLERYGIQAACTVQPGQEIKTESLYDLIIIDAPCSNTGVFNKRPEARWRFSKESLNSLQKIQRELIEHAKNLLSPEGQIWYMTCSILKEENEALVEKMHPIYQKIVLPNEDGWDGGFSAVIEN